MQRIVREVFLRIRDHLLPYYDQRSMFKLFRTTNTSQRNTMYPHPHNTPDQEQHQSDDAGTLDLTETGPDYETPVSVPLPRGTVTDAEYQLTSLEQVSW